MTGTRTVAPYSLVSALATHIIFTVGSCAGTVVYVSHSSRSHTGTCSFSASSAGLVLLDSIGNWSSPAPDTGLDGNASNVQHFFMGVS